jgi:GAF domain-containing protein
VRQRTRELQYKVKELEGKDRIAHHMLSVNSLEETLELILQIIADIIETDKAVVYLLDGDTPNAVAAIGALQPKTIALQAKLKNLEQTPIHTQAFARVVEAREPVNIKDPKGKPIPPFAVVPILAGDDFLGFIEIANPESMGAVSPEEVKLVASFALQAAIAISDAQAQSNTKAWKDELENVLKDVSDIEDTGV